MSDPLYAFPTACGLTLRALARYPSRVAFSWPGGSISYAGATELIGRMQKAFVQLGIEPGSRVAFLTANRGDSWCAGVAAQLSRLAITWLHPLGSLEDQLFQIADSDSRVLVIDTAAFFDRGGDLATKAANLSAVFTLGPAITASIFWPRSRRRARRARSVWPAPTISRRSTTPVAPPGNPRAPCAPIANMAASPAPYWPTSKFRISRAI